jgi:hypothetical protein
MKYLGFIIKVGKDVYIDLNKVKAILEWQTPISTYGVRLFLGFVNFYQYFIWNFSDIVQLLTALI